ncbi:hypothetical protein DH2020_006144 [Rehmannia glutinosa]|uniref:Uncharacterized protein n=1 Tax=Rehmannia glutinosa TaxID=99300 RepID=A0ABR0XI12_REHGL
MSSNSKKSRLWLPGDCSTVRNLDNSLNLPPLCRYKHALDQGISGDRLMHGSSDRIYNKDNTRPQRRRLENSNARRLPLAQQSRSLAADGHPPHPHWSAFFYDLTWNFLRLNLPASSVIPPPTLLHHCARQWGRASSLGIRLSW